MSQGGGRKGENLLPRRAENGLTPPWEITEPPYRDCRLSVSSLFLPIFFLLFSTYFPESDPKCHDSHR
ncbi:hypothetical protein QC764_0084490 [Podospora pseudoanserina]|uniref:Uncharacterized protein n=1 Tax=Podospora pseudoanserina TaxID=2609844 RepID=A0ABR0I6R0_9PEZI|nr:hypothetical protein QC764_0084490 [Podospora pseudoanserina]